MIIAYSYRLQYTDNCYSLFLDGILLATIKRIDAGTWYVNVKFNGDRYLFVRTGWLNRSVQVHNIKAGENLGDISLPVFPLFFRRSTFLLNTGAAICWHSLNLFSFHWAWKSGGNILLEGVEDFVIAGNSGVIKLHAYQHESYMLIIAGIFLSISRKRRGICRIIYRRP